MRSVALLLATSLLLTGCSGESSPAPTSPTPSPTTPAPPAPTSSLTRVWLCCGSNQVTLNTERQLEVHATYADGSSRDVTSGATSWKTSKPNIATISDTGVVKGLAEGDFEVSASYEGIAATWGMYVPVNVYQPAGPDEVSGTVREITVLGEVPVWRAEVEVVGGSNNGRKVQTDTGGLFRISGLQASGFELIVRDAGYSQKRFRVDALGVDVSSETIMTPSPTMISEVFEGPVCWPTNTITKSFTPATPGILRITSTRQQSAIRQVYEDGVLIDRHLYDHTDVQTRAGATYELRVTGSCDYNPSVNVRMTLLRPR